MRIAFLLPRIELAGGIFIVLEHARGLAERHGHDVLIVTTEDRAVTHAFPSLSDLTSASIDDVAGERFDIAIATWWHTVYSLPRVVAARYAQFVQNLEDRFYTPSDVAARAGAGAIQTLPLAYITTSGWLERQLRALRPDAAVYCVRSGIDKEIFCGPPGPDTYTGPLRIVVEGPTDVWFKGVPEALDAVRRMREPRHVTVMAGERAPTAELVGADRVLGRLSHAEVASVFRESDVLLKLSRVEGMAGPPLEAFHCGATVVTTPVTGHEEYATHGVNCLIVGFDDIVGTARALDVLSRDRSFLGELRAAALATASEWPQWDEATQQLDAAIADIAGSSSAADPTYVRRLIDETYAGYLRELRLQIEGSPRRGQPEVDGRGAARTRPPGFFERVRWVWAHEGAAGVARKIARRLVPLRRAGTDATESSARSDGAAGAGAVTEIAGASADTSAEVDRRLAGADWLDDESRLIFLFGYTPREGDVVVDAGAGNGQEVVTFARLVGPNGKVIAVEPHPHAFEELRELCEANGLRNVELVHAALASRSGTATLTDLPEPLLNSTVGGGEGSITVKAVALDDLVRKLGIHRVDFLKMNIEGAEVDALNGFEQAVRRTRHVCIGCHDFLAEDGRGGDELRTRADVEAFLKASGFVVFSQPHELPWIADYLYGSSTPRGMPGEEEAQTETLSA